jgi:hypothetical protein
MYDPFALDRIRIEQEARRRSVAVPRPRRVRTRSAGRFPLTALWSRRDSL